MADHALTDDALEPSRTTPAATRPRGGRVSRWRAGGGLPLRSAMVFLLPALVLFGIFVLYPMLTAFSYSFFSWRGTARSDFSGLDNFFTLFTQDPYKRDIPNAFLHNVLMFIGAIVGQNTLGMALAVALHRRRWGKRLFQVLFTMPYLVSPIVIGYLWTLMLSPTFGPVNAMLKAIGLESLALPWLGSPTTAIWVVVVVSVWQWVGFPMLLYGAALGGIPEELDEAASVDGATARQRFFSITLPLLWPAIITVSILAFIGAMESLALPYAMGGVSGSPAGATDVLSLVFYRIAFESGASNGVGLSSALATLLFVFIFGVALLTTYLSRRREEALT
ncbi:sugar ABC transporter permease [Microbacterium soli]|uniref:Sugar ABC transporter permease n=1 Tax=Microbacterium soli TaxID=446075 RepID=A0ABP7MWX1_9MICO